MEKLKLAIIHCDIARRNDAFSFGKCSALDISKLNKVRICNVGANARRFGIDIFYPLANQAGARFPDPGRFDAIIIPGSAHTPTRVNIRRHGWMRELFGFIKDAGQLEVPLFGSCFGFQAIAAAFGVPSVPLQSGKEFGFYPVSLTPEGVSDPLFRGVDRGFYAAYSHRYIVPRLPPGAVLLATSSRFKVQAFRIGKMAYAAQFHPDFNTEQFMNLAKPKDGKMPGKRTLAAPDRGRNNERVLQNFLDMVSKRCANGKKCEILC